jgi:hypothetical protein
MPDQPPRDMLCDESVRSHLQARLQDADAPAQPRHTVELDPAESLRLLGSVSLGRIVFTRHALPAIRPVNHIVHGADIIVRTHQGSALAAYVQGVAAPGVVVAYEADVIDPDTHVGWSVVATGYAGLVTDQAELDHYQGRLQP